MIFIQLSVVAFGDVLRIRMDGELSVFGASILGDQWSHLLRLSAPARGEDEREYNY
jgi:hypothetical protein